MSEALRNVSLFDLQVCGVSAVLKECTWFLIYDLYWLKLLATVKSHRALTVIDRFHKSAILEPASL